MHTFLGLNNYPCAADYSPEEDKTIQKVYHFRPEAVFCNVSLPNVPGVMCLPEQLKQLKKIVQLKPPQQTTTTQGKELKFIRF